MDEFHLLENGGLQVMLDTGRGTREDRERTFPDSLAPRRSILISFFVIIWSLLSWDSISSLPG
jgi:hypothetical protein